MIDIQFIVRINYVIKICCVIDFAIFIRKQTKYKLLESKVRILHIDYLFFYC